MRHPGRFLCLDARLCSEEGLEEGYGKDCGFWGCVGSEPVWVVLQN